MQPLPEAGDNPGGRIYENAKELHSAYIELALHTRIDPRRDAQVSALIWNPDMDVARATLEQIKEDGTWPLYSYRLLTSPLAQKPVDNIRMLLDEGACLCRYDDQFTPTIFQSWQSWSSAPLCVSLLDILLGAGLGINDEDIEGRNLLDVIMADFKNVSHIGAAIPSTTRIHGYLDAIQAMIERGALPRSDYPQRLGECAKKLAIETDPRMLQVVGMLQARLDMTTLDEDTPRSQEQVKLRRL